MANKCSYKGKEEEFSDYIRDILYDEIGDLDKTNPDLLNLAKKSLTTILNYAKNTYNLQSKSAIADTIREVYDEDFNLLSLLSSELSKESLIERLGDTVQEIAYETVNNLYTDEKLERRSKITRTYMDSFFGTAARAKMSFNRNTLRSLLDATIINRNTGTIITNNSVLNENLRNLQESLFKDIVDYLKVMDSDFNDSNLVLYDSDRSYTGNYEAIKRFTDKYIANNKSDLQQLYERVKNNYGSRLDITRLKAINSYLFLENFDQILAMDFGNSFVINDFGSFSNEHKYAFSDSGSKVYTTWRVDENIDVESEIDNITLHLITSCKMYDFNTGLPMNDNFLDFSSFGYIVGKIKMLTNNPSIYNINISKDYYEVYNQLSENTKNLVDKYENLGELISGIRANPIIHLPAIFEILSNKNFYTNNNSIQLVNELKDIDKNLIYTLYKEIFSEKDNSIRSISHNNKNMKYYQYITQTIDSIYNVEYLQYHKTDNGIYKVRTLSNQGIDKISKNLETIIYANNSKAMCDYEQRKAKYNIQYSEGEVTYAIKDGNKVLLNVKVNVKSGEVSFTDVNGKPYYFEHEDFDNTILKSFIEEVLRLNIGIDQNTAYGRALEQIYKYKADAITDLMELVSDIITNQAVSHTFEDGMSPLEMKTKVDSIYGNDQIQLNYNLADINYIRNTKIPKLVRLAEAKAITDGLITASTVKDSLGNSQSVVTLSRLLGSFRTQWDQQVKKNPTARNLLILDNNLFKGVYTSKEAISGGSQKENTEWNVSEYAYSNFVIDYLGSFIQTNQRHIIGNYVAGFIPSVNSDKNTISRMLMNLAYQYNTITGGTKAIKDFNNFELLNLVRQQLAPIYQETLRTLEHTLQTIFNENQILSKYDTHHEISTDFSGLNKLIKSGVDVVNLIQETAKNYNLLNPDNIIEIKDELHFVVNEDGTLSSNHVLLDLINRLNNVKVLSWWQKRKNFDVFVSAINSDFQLTLNGKQPQLTYLKGISDWVDFNSSKMILGKFIIDGQTYNISSNTDLIKLYNKFTNKIEKSMIENGITEELSKAQSLYLIADSFTLHPELEKWNLLDYLFTQEWMITTVGSHIAHPAKYKTSNVTIEEALRYNAQHKRNVSMTAQTHSFQLGQKSGIPSHYKIAIIEDTKAVGFNVSGDYTKRIKPLEGATFVDPITVYLENNSLNGDKAGVDKKQFVHFYDEKTCTGGIIKTAGFGLTNDKMRKSFEFRAMHKQSNNIVWLNEDNKTPFSCDISKLEFQNLYFRGTDGNYYKIIDIKQENPEVLDNNYTRIIKKVDSNGNIIDDTPIEQSFLNVNTNYKLHDLYGGYFSHSLIDGNLVPSEASIQAVVNAVINIEDSNGYQPLKHSNINYLVTEGAIKQGSANKNSKSVYGNPDAILNYMYIKMLQAGIQLDKEHHADQAELSLMTQVINGAAFNGFTMDVVNRMYEGLYSFTKLRTANFREAFKDLDTDPNKIKDIVINTVIKELGNSTATNDINFATSIAKELIKRANNGEKITFKNSNLPLSDSTIYNKVVQIISSFLTNNGIKVKVPGTLSVLHPSHGFMKIYGDTLLSDYYNPTEQLQELQNSIKASIGNKYNTNVRIVQGDNPVFPYLIYYNGEQVGSILQNGEVNYSTKVPKNITEATLYELSQQVGDFEISGLSEHMRQALDNLVKDGIAEFDGTNYKVKRINIVDELSNINIGRKYLVQLNGNTLEQFREELIQKVIRDSYSNFVEADTDLNNRIVALLKDLESIIKNPVFNIESPIEYNRFKTLVNLGFVKSATEYVMEGRDLASYNVKFQTSDGRKFQLYDIDCIQDLFQLKQSNFVGFNALKLAYKYGVKVNENLKTNLEKVIRKEVQKSLNALSKHHSDSTVSIDGILYTVDKKSITKYSAEVIMPKVFATNFGLKRGDTLKKVKSDPYFFVKRIIQNYATKVSNSNNYNIELKNTNGKHIYLLTDRSKISDNIKVQAMFKYTEDGNLYRTTNDQKNLLYQLSSNNDVLYVDENGNEILYTENPEFYINSLGYNSINISESTSEEAFNNLLDIFKTSKNKTAQRYYNTFSKIQDRTKVNSFYNKIGTYNIIGMTKEQLDSLRQHDELFNNLCNKGDGIYQSFLKTLNIVAARIPAQSYQSFMSMEVVAFETEDVNRAYVSSSQIWLQGSDFDIDCVSLATFGVNSSGIFETWSPFSNISSKELMEASTELPFPTSEKIIKHEFADTVDEYIKNNNLTSANDRVEAKRRIDEWAKQKLIKILQDNLVNNGGFISISKLNDTESKVKFILNTSKQIESLGKFIQEFKAIYYPSDTSLIYILNTLTGNTFNKNQTRNAIDKLIGLIDKHNTYFNELNRDKQELAIKNFNMQNLYEAASDPINQVQAMTSVDATTGPLKKQASKAKTTLNTRNTGNVFEKFEGINDNQVGKNGISICATGLKGMSALQQYVNYILKYGTYAQKLRTRLGPNGRGITINGKTYNTLANANFYLDTTEILNEAARLNLEDPTSYNNWIKYLKVKSESNEDSAVLASALLSLATDRTKIIVF